MKFHCMLLALAIAVGLCIPVAGCPNPAPVVTHAVVDCLKIEGSDAWNKVQTQLQPDITAGNWQKLIADSETLGLQFGVDTARCVAMELIQHYLLVKQANTSGTWSGAHDAADEIRKNAGGATFHTKDGDI